MKHCRCSELAEDLLSDTMTQKKAPLVHLLRGDDRRPEEPTPHETPCVRYLG